MQKQCPNLLFSIFAKLTHFNYNCMLDASFSRFIVFVFFCILLETDIQEFYELTLLDDTKTIQQKTVETLQIASKWEQENSLKINASEVSYIYECTHNTQSASQQFTKKKKKEMHSKHFQLTIRFSLRNTFAYTLHICFFLLFFLFRNAQQAKESIVNSAHLPLTQALINLKEQQELAENQVIFINGFSSTQGKSKRNIKC